MRIVDGTLKQRTALEGCEITFLTRDLAEVGKLFDKYAKVPLNAKIEPLRRKRSLDANSYLWVLCNKIAESAGTTKLEVYKSHIEAVGVFDEVAVITKAVRRFLQNWNDKGDGWIAEIQPNCKLKGCSKVRCYYGSSSYDSKQMARLIDNVVQEAKQMEIEVLTPNELEELKQKWGM